MKKFKNFISQSVQVLIVFLIVGLFLYNVWGFADWVYSH